MATAKAKKNEEVKDIIVELNPVKAVMLKVINS